MELEDKNEYLLSLWIQRIGKYYPLPDKTSANPIELSHNCYPDRDLRSIRPLKALWRAFIFYTTKYILSILYTLPLDSVL